MQRLRRYKWEKKEKKTIDINKPILVKGWNRIFKDWTDFMSYLSKSKSNLKSDTIEAAIQSGMIKNIEK